MTSNDYRPMVPRCPTCQQRWTLVLGIDFRVQCATLKGGCGAGFELHQIRSLYIPLPRDVEESLAQRE